MTEPLGSSSPLPGLPSRGWRIAISLLVVGHLWSVISRPIEFATQGPFGTSPAATSLRAPVRAYSEWMYLDHGYAFFAPDPGPSHLIRATIQTPGQPSVQRLYPDLADQWPRLLYHRHFMLAEFWNNVYHPPGDPPPQLASDPRAVQQWYGSRKRYEAIRDSIQAALLQKYPGSEVRLERLEHRQPGLPEFLEGGWTIDDPRLVTVLPDQATADPSTLLPDEPQTALEPLPPTRRTANEVSE